VLLEKGGKARHRHARSAQRGNLDAQGKLHRTSDR
jgi:hypothetical protein